MICMIVRRFTSDCLAERGYTLVTARFCPYSSNLSSCLVRSTVLGEGYSVILKRCIPERQNTRFYLPIRIALTRDEQVNPCSRTLIRSMDMRPGSHLSGKLGDTAWSTPLSISTPRFNSGGFLGAFRSLCRRLQTPPLLCRHVQQGCC